MAEAAAQPAISIVTATYNRPQWLSCAIRSVLKQTFADWELIVVGDACTDNTAEVVEGFGDERIRFLNLTRNFGEQAGPNNIGFAESSAPLLAILNHDDVWLPHHLAVCRETLLGEGADFVFGASVSLNPQSVQPFRFDGLSVGISGAGAGHSWSPVGVEESAAPASSWLMRCNVAETLRGWRLGRDCYSDPSQDFLFRVWRAGFRIRAVRDITLVRVISGRRPGSYATEGAAEQEWILQHVEDPAFACELAALAYESNDHFNRRSGGRFVLARRAAGHLVAAMGVSPRALYFRLRKGFGAGEYITFLRAGRGLPTFSPPRGQIPAMRFDMVRRSCRVELPSAIDFSAGAGGARFLASGWSRPEGTGVWNDGPEASLLFDLGARPEADVLASFDVLAFLAPDENERVVEVSVDQAKLETWRLKGSPATFGIRIPRASLRHQILHLTFRFPSTGSPKRSGLSDDPRDLAMHLIRAGLTLDAAIEPAMPE